MPAILARLFDVLFPPRKEELIVRRLSKDDVVALMQPKEDGGISSLFRYRDPTIRALIWQLKYKRDRKAAELLGCALQAHLQRERALIIPIPLSSERMRERGYNQVSLIARNTSCEVLEHVLRRTEHRDRQTILSRKERLENLHGVFEVRNCEHIRGKDLILLDDVATTGTTLREAENALRACGPRSIRKIALAH